jgi:hypothetical protein
MGARRWCTAHRRRPCGPRTTTREASSQPTLSSGPAMKPCRAPCPLWTGRCASSHRACSSRVSAALCIVVRHDMRYPSTVAGGRAYHVPGCCWCVGSGMQLGSRCHGECCLLPGMACAACWLWQQPNQEQCAYGTRMHNVPGLA